MPILVPLYSEQPLNRDAQEIFEAVLEDFPKGTFEFKDITTAMQQPPPYNFFRTVGTKILAFGSTSLFGVNFNYPYEIIRTYSVAQICTKANAVSVLKAALNQFYLTQKVHPTSIFYNHTMSTSSLHEFDYDKPIAVDIETSGNLDTETPEQVGILSIAFYQEGRWAVWDFRNEGADFYSNAAKILREIKYPIWHNGKFDIRVIEAQLGVRMPNFFDTMLAHHVLNMAAGLHALKPLCKMYLGAPEWEADLSKYLKNKAHYELVPANILNEYNCWDVYWTYELWKYLEPLILSDEQSSKAFMLEMAASDFLLDVEQFGFAVDVPYAKSLQRSMQQDLAVIEGDLFQMTQGVTFKTNKPFNPASWQQVQTVISQLSGLHYSGSTDEKTLTKIKQQQPNLVHTVLFIDKLLEYRKTAKALVTYVEGALNNEVNGRVHTTFKIHGTSTGRLSSAGPNIQNIPRDKRFRSIYVG